MNPTTVLSEEHQVIKQVLHCLEKMANQAKLQGNLDKEAAQKAILFFRHFADQCHHDKEEAILFPAMETKGFPREGGPTGVMIIEHEQGRQHVRAMEENIEGAAQGDSEALQRFGEHAHAFHELLWEHIEKENHCLFPMADEAFTEEEQQKLTLAFEEAESKKTGTGVHQKYLAIANELADQFDVPHATAAETGHAEGKCCH